MMGIQNRLSGWTLLEIHALTSHAAVGVKLRTALSRTFPSWQKLQPTLTSIESNLATWGTSPHLSKLQFVSREPWNNGHLVLVGHSCWRCKSLPTAFPGSRGRFREYATRIHNTSISKFTWSTKWFSLLSWSVWLNLPSLPGFLGSCPICFSAVLGKKANLNHPFCSQ